MAQEKQNPSLDVNETLTQSEAFLIKNKKNITVVIVAIVLVVGGFFAFKYGYQKPREEKAQTLLALGQTYFIGTGTGQPDYEKALSGDGKTFPGYVKIANDYSFTNAANIANLYCGICYAKTGKVKEAITYLEKFSPKGDITLSPAGVATLANCYAMNKEIDKAIETFRKAAGMADNASLSPIFLLEAGKLLESQKKNEEALKLYNEIKEKYPLSTLASPSQQNGKIMAPELDKYIERVSQ